MTISEEILKKISIQSNEIIYSKFIQKIRSGTLESDKFVYYMIQDVNFLKYYAKCNAIIAAKISSEYKEDFVAYTKSSITYIKFVEEYFFEHPEYQSNSTTRATEGYTSHLVRNCATEPLELALSAILACELLYKALGAYLKSNSVTNNPYEPWYLPLSDPEYVQGVDRLQYIVDDYGLAASNATQSEMIDIGAKGYVWEYEFFQDSYTKQIFNDY